MNAFANLWNCDLVRNGFEMNYKYIKMLQNYEHGYMYN